MFPGQSLIKCELIISIFTRLHQSRPRRPETQSTITRSGLRDPRVGQLPVPHRFLIVNSIIPAHSQLQSRSSNHSNPAAILRGFNLMAGAGRGGCPGLMEINFTKTNHSLCLCHSASRAITGGSSVIYVHHSSAAFTHPLSHQARG